jgi:hypothetical protein
MIVLHKNVYFSTVDQHTEENGSGEKSSIPQKGKRGRPRKERGTKFIFKSMGLDLNLAEFSKTFLLN